MDTPIKRIVFSLLGIWLIFLSACAPSLLRKEFPSDQLLAYRLESGTTLSERFAPVFIVENNIEPYNRIGTPSVRVAENGKETIYVDSGKATIYGRTNAFKTAKGDYTNLFYRIHFDKIPFGAPTSHLGQGKNVGLFVIVTLNSRHQPVLYTSVHTCGCYLAFVPTSFMPADAFPDDWDKGPQSVYSETLPGLLDFKGMTGDNAKTVIRLRTDTHRVKVIHLAKSGSLSAYKTVTAALQPLDELERIPLENGETTSFYETSGSRRGYVKGSHKPWEKLFMSWWALDWRIGEDKKLGKDTDDGIVFFTSLKPWARKKSDLRDFASFLEYWKWKL